MYNISYISKLFERIYVLDMKHYAVFLLLSQERWGDNLVIMLQCSQSNTNRGNKDVRCLEIKCFYNNSCFIDFPQNRSYYYHIFIPYASQKIGFIVLTSHQTYTYLRILCNYCFTLQAVSKLRVGSMLGGLSALCFLCLRHFSDTFTQT